MEACYRQGLTLWWKESACSLCPHALQLYNLTCTPCKAQCVFVSVLPRSSLWSLNQTGRSLPATLVNWDKPGTSPKASQLEYRREQYHVHSCRSELERSSGRSHLILDNFFYWINCSFAFSKQDIMLSLYTWLVHYSFLSILLLLTFIFVFNLCQGFVWLLYSHSFLYSLTEHEIHPQQSL